MTRLHTEQLASPSHTQWLKSARTSFSCGEAVALATSISCFPETPVSYAAHASFLGVQNTVRNRLGVARHVEAQVEELTKLSKKIDNVERMAITRLTKGETMGNSSAGRSFD